MLHLTKVAFGASSLDHLLDSLNHRTGRGPVVLTTRNLPKRHAEITGKGSLFWILKHQLVARTPILGFGEAEGGRVSILLGAETLQVLPAPKRAHQGWRYLEAADAPGDLRQGEAPALLPPNIARELAALALL
ncbi:MAG: hypothetical protein A4S12_12905 [Proteobacteria bacterium SG_bin5]|nr:DUF1489 domain-containing protein [Sphingomonas sp.]OQW45276.1 MAG: hypothetical protein A4S12_12905 [Proteobacteria bacterium SG_bin5]